MMAFGGMMIGRNDLPHIFQMSRSLSAAGHVGSMLARYARDRLTHQRGTRHAARQRQRSDRAHGGRSLRPWDSPDVIHRSSSSGKRTGASPAP
jgi:hypothetical protein